MLIKPLIIEETLEPLGKNNCNFTTKSIEMNDQDLGEILKAHIANISSLKYGDSDTAELLYHKTKMFSEKFFKMAYSADLIGLKFRVQFKSIEDLNTIWNQNIPKLYAIAKAMHDDYSLSDLLKPKTIIKPEIKYVEVESGKKIDKLENQISTLQSQLDVIESRKKRIKKDILFGASLILPSVFLWTFNFLIRWEWLEQHPKKIAIYLGSQLLIFLLSIRIIKKNKAIDIATIVAAIGIIISLL